ncbi:MAG: LysM domain-containing protein [Geobacteraceae bacterium]|nr:LysM domain-containing protein [Geobacteraceae bacterium]
MDPRFELDSQTLGVPAATSSKKADAKTKNLHRARKYKYHVPVSAQGKVHVVRSGDNLFKILMRDYGLSNAEAEKFLEEIRRVNNIADIRRIKIGQKIIIPPVRRRADGTIKSPSPKRLGDGAAGVIGQSFNLESPVSPLTEHEAVVKVRQVWDKILPPLKGEQKPIILNSPTFSLALDPQRYPVYATMHAGKILVDPNASIPPLVKTLITEKDPAVRIVSESPVNGKRFLAAMLDSAGFYSVEENFSMDFGTDPKLTIQSDFKIEKTPDSLIKQDVVLLNSGRVPLPSVLGTFLKKEGFKVYEPFASLQPVVPAVSRPLCQITAKSQTDIIDALLASISLTPDKDRRLDVFAADNNGISLAVKAERYFERGGQHYVVTRFDGDPVTYTLFRFLETKGFRVTILEPRDGFRKIAEKLLSSMQIPGAYTRHTLAGDAGGNYSLQMSGFKLEGKGLPVGGLFVTDLKLDRVIRDLLQENGYHITSK